MNNTRLRRLLFILLIATSFVTVALLPKARKATVSAQTKPWKTWVKVSPCSVTRLDWVSSAQVNPNEAGGGEGGGPSFWYAANVIVPGAPCARDVENCSFATAQAALPAIRGRPEFLIYCCHDYAVYENDRTKERVYLKSSSGGPGSLSGPWSLVQASLCCEEAQGLAGKSGGCGVPDYGSNTQHQNGKVIDGMDMPGNDLVTIDVSNSDARTCTQYCLANENCKGFTYAKAGSRGTSAKCILKAAVSKMVPAACCSSAVVDVMAMVTGNTGDISMADGPVAKLGDVGDVRSTPKPKNPGTNADTRTAQTSKNVKPCTELEKAAFAKLSGTVQTKFGSKVATVTIGGSCENAQGTVDASSCPISEGSNSYVSRRFQFSGRMSGEFLNVDWRSSDALRGNGYCHSLRPRGMACNGFGCTIRDP